MPMAAATWFDAREVVSCYEQAPTAGPASRVRKYGLLRMWAPRTLGKKLVLSKAEGMAAFLNFSPSGRDQSEEQAAEILFSAAC